MFQYLIMLLFLLVLNILIRINEDIQSNLLRWLHNFKSPLSLNDYFLFLFLEVSSSAKVGLEKCDNGGVAIFGISFSLSPNIGHFPVLDDSYINSAGSCFGRVAVDLDVRVCFSDSIFKSSGRASISSWSAVFNVDLLNHLK